MIRICPVHFTSHTMFYPWPISLLAKWRSLFVTRMGNKYWFSLRPKSHNKTSKSQLNIVLFLFFNYSHLHSQIYLQNWDHHEIPVTISISQLYFNASHSFLYFLLHTEWSTDLFIDADRFNSEKQQLMTPRPPSAWSSIKIQTRCTWSHLRHCWSRMIVNDHCCFLILSLTPSPLQLSIENHSKYAQLPSKD